MSKLEYDLENFGRLCHLHDKVAKLEQALAEKDRELQQIREHEFQRGFQEGEAAAKEAMDNDHDAEQREEIARLREALKSIVEGDWLWSASDMVHAAQQTLKELPCGDT